MAETTNDNRHPHPTTTAPSPSTSTPTSTTTTATPPTTTPTPTSTPIPEITSFLQPTSIPGLLKRRDDLDMSGLTAISHPSIATNTSSRCSSVNPNDTLPSTPTPGAQPQPYPPQMRMPAVPSRDNPRPTPHVLGAQEDVRAATHERADHHNQSPQRDASYTVVRRCGENHPSGYRQNSEAVEEPRYCRREEEGGEDTLLGKLGKWVEGINSRIVETGIAGDVKGKGKGKGKGKQ